MNQRFKAYGVTEIDIAEQSRTNDGVGQVSSFQVYVGQIGTDKVRFFKIGAAEVRSTQVSTTKICIDKYGILHNCPADIRLA